MDIQSKFGVADTKTNVRPTTLGVMQGWGRMSAEKDGHWAFFDSRDWEPVEEWMTIQVKKQGWDTAMREKLWYQLPHTLELNGYVLVYRVVQ